jgi:hypothetical protein
MKLATLFRLLLGAGLTAVVFAQTGPCLVGLLTAVLLVTVVFTPLTTRWGVS